MLFRKLWRTIGQYRAQFLSMILMIALGAGIFVGFNMEWVSIEENTGAFFDATGFADFRLVETSGFSPEDLDAVLSIDGVDDAARFFSQTVDVEERDGDTLTLSVTENDAVSGVWLTEGEAYDGESEDGLWLSDRYAAENGIFVGDELTLVYERIRLTGVVRGLVKASEHLICVRDETQLMPDYASHGFVYVSPVLLEKALGFSYYPQIHVRSSLSKRDFTRAVDEALGRTVMLLTKNEVISYAEAMGESEEGKTMGTILPVLFLAIAVLTMVTTMHRLTAREKTQIGTLKALGLKDRRILRHYTSYALMIGIPGIALGVGLGYLIGWYIMNPGGMMGTYLDMPEWKLPMPWFCTAALLGILVLLTVIGYLSVRRMLRGTAADSLRPYTPRRVRPLLLERTRLWALLGFGARWNLRDVMRHKARSLMSLLGVLGCAVLLIASFGMRDTMDAFLDLYYENAIGYATRINLSDGASPEDAEAIAQQYHGDTSGTVSVQLEDKAVSLEIYDTPGELVRFPAEDEGFVELEDDGAYVCLRLAREFDLQPGDRFSVSPFGSDDRYTLRVAGLVRSISESIVLTPAYADALDLPYAVSFVYTDTAKEDVAPDEAISTVQSKKAILDSFDAFIEIMDLMIWLLVAAAVLLGVIVLYNLGVMSYTERYRELATLKVVGFRDRKIGRLLVAQNLWISVAGLLLGIPLGVWVLRYLLDNLAGEYEMRLAIAPASYALSVLLTVGMSLAVSALIARKNRKIDMVEALKGAE